MLAGHIARSDGLSADTSATALAAQRHLVESLGGSYHSIVGDDVPRALLEFARAQHATQLVLGTSRRSRLNRFLTGPGIGETTIRLSGDIDVHIVTHAEMGRGRGLARPHGAITLRRQVIGYVLGIGLPLLLTLALAGLRSSLNLTSDALLFLVAVIVVALTTVRPVAAVVPKSTVVAPVKLVPVIVTNVPPASRKSTTA